MFWSSIAAQSTLNDLLDRSDLTIAELLEDDNVLQKCREKDPRLIDFLCRQENVDYLVNLISKPAVPDDFDKSLYREPSLACEILTCDISPLLDVVIQTSSSSGSENQPNSMVVDTSGGGMNKTSSEVSTVVTNGIASAEQSPSPQKDLTKSSPTSLEPRPFLDRLLNAIDAPLNPLTASFVSRVLVHLAIQRGQEVIPYFRSSYNLIERVVSRFDLTAMPDFLLQLAQQERGSQQLIFEWFTEDRLAQRLIQGFSADRSWQVHESTSHCLVQLIVCLRSYLANNTCTGPDSDSSTVFESGLPANNPYAMLMDEDTLTYTAATKLLDSLESEESLNAILDHLTNHNTVTTSIIVGCTDVFSAILDKRRPETGFNLSGNGPGGGMEDLVGGNLFDSSNSGLSRGNGLFGLNGLADGSNQPDDKSESVFKTRVTRASATLAKACLPRVHDLHILLQNPHRQTSNRMCTTVGSLDPPLGRGRLAIAHFIAVLMTLPVETGIAAALVKEGVIGTLMGLFEKYPFNTLIHQAVIDVTAALFSRAHLIEAKPANAKESTAAKDGVRPSNKEDEQDRNGEEETSMDTGVDLENNSKSEDPTVNLLDDAFTTIMKEHHLTDWCLRLVPLSSKTTTNPTAKPAKPGYVGHLWKLANSIEEARKGPRKEFVDSVFESLSPSSRSSWEEFVADNLAKVNALQVPDDVSEAKADRDDTLIQFLINRELGSLFSQPTGLFNLTSESGTPGKFSLFFSPFSLGDQLNNKNSSGRSGLGFVALAGDKMNDDNETRPVNPSISTAMWVDTGEVGHEGEPTSNLSDEAAFRSARLASFSSDDSEPDEDRNDNDDDDDEDEEDLKSPVIIRQQRSTMNRTAPLIGHSDLKSSEEPPTSGNPWTIGSNGPGEEDESQTGWAQFEDTKHQDEAPATDQTVNGMVSQHTSEHPTSTKEPPGSAPVAGNPPPNKNASIVPPTTEVP